MSRTARATRPQTDAITRTTEIADLLGLEEGQSPTVKDLSLLLEIDLKLGRKKQFYQRVQNAMDYLLDQAQQECGSQRRFH